MVTSVCMVHGNDISEPNAGTNRVVAMARGLKEAGYNVQMVLPKPQGKIPEKLKDIEIHFISIGIGNSLNKIFRAYMLLSKAKKIARKNNSILQIQLSTLGGFAALMGYSGYFLEMNDLAFESPVYTSLPLSKFMKKVIYNIERKSVENASKVIVVSNSLKEYIINEWNVPANKIKTIENGFFEDVFEKIEEKPETNTIIRTGSLFKHLNVDNIIKMSEYLSNQDIKILLIGDGEIRKSLEQTIQEKNIKNIEITGWLDYYEAMKLTSQAKITFLSMKKSLTTEMACPVKVLDYAALGKAMVLSDVSDLSKIFQENNAALVSHPDDKNAFIENIYKLLSDDTLRNEIGKNAKKLSKEFTWKSQAAKLVQSYEDYQC